MRLVKILVCTWLSGILNHGMCGNICGVDSIRSIFNRYHRLLMGCTWLYDSSGLYTV